MSIYRRTNIERETIINYNQEEDTATVYTWSKPLIRKLTELLDVRDDIQRKNGDDECATFIVPKTWIKVSPPRTVNLTEEQKAERAERMRKARESKLGENS